MAETHDNIVMKQPYPGEKPGGPPPDYNNGAGMPIAAPIVGQPQMGFSNMRMPPVLEYLSSLNKINIHQVLHLDEVLLGWERNNRYNICNEQEQQFLTAKEETDCCTRQWCGNIRPFDIFINDMQGQPIMQLNRDFHCQGCLCPCSQQEMDIFYPIGQKVATIKEIYTCCVPRYEILDAAGSLVFKIEGPTCWFACCTDIEFNVTRADGQDAGQIVKHWGGCREVFGQVNDFSVSFVPGENPINKAILLGSTFLVDFMYFERKNNK